MAETENDTATIFVTELLCSVLEIQPERIQPDARLMEDLGADSLDAVILLDEAEKKLGITIPDDDALEFRTVGDMIHYYRNTMTDGLQSV